MTDILATTLGLGALYAVSAISLALIWGTFGMLNLAHGAFIAVGAYASLLAVRDLGMPWWFGVVAGAAGGAAIGAVTHYLLVSRVFARPGFEINIIILTMAAAMIIVDGINNIIGPATVRQPFSLDGRIAFGSTSIAWQTVMMIAISALLTAVLTLTLRYTSLGRSINAVAQEPTAARLNGISVGRVVLKVMIISGAIAGVSGVLITQSTAVYPTVGQDPLLKALIICVIGGLGSIPGAIIAAFFLALLETVAQYELGTKWGSPVLLIAVVAVLVLRPNGLFGTRDIARN
jgi:branched-subunit amino acid ABC-type transport system permease component